MLILAYAWIITFFVFGLFNTVNAVTKASDSTFGLLVAIALYFELSYVGYGATAIVMRDLHAFGL